MFIANLLEKLEAEITVLMSQPLLWSCLLVFLLIASYTDIKSLKIPNWLTGSFLFTRLLLIPFVGISWSDIGAAIFLYAFIFIIGFITYTSMGGDLKAVFVIGLYLGFSLSVVFIVLSIVYLALVGIFYTIRKAKKDTDIPFAPIFLVAYLSLFILI